MSAIRRGTACVEFAVIAPFIFFLIFCSIEFSRMLMVKQALTNASREGCRSAALANSQSLSEVESVVRDSLKGTVAQYADDQQVRVQVTPNSLSAVNRGDRVTVSIEVNCQDVSWMSTMLFVNSVIQTSTSMTRE